jgi:hypothetical protein
VNTTEANSPGAVSFSLEGLLDTDPAGFQVFHPQEDSLGVTEAAVPGDGIRSRSRP